MPNGVKCSVSNCTFWDEGNRCGADQIDIEIDGHAHVNLKEEFGEELGEHKDRAKQSAATCCHTFKPKE